jgi:hypothetical protein
MDAPQTLSMDAPQIQPQPQIQTQLQPKTPQVKFPSIDNLNPKSTRVWAGEGPEANNHLWYVQEKLDGSQFTFVLNPDYNPEDPKSPQLLFYNKGGAINPTNKIFLKAMNMLNVLAKTGRMSSQYVYHGEAICSTNHGVVKYERVPKYYVVLYDLTTLDGKYQHPATMKAEATRLGLEAAPVLYFNFDRSISPYEVCQRLVDEIAAGKIKSMLGGTPEGVVLKHESFVSRGKTVATKLKLVTPAFRESHAMKQHKEQATPASSIEEIGKAYSLEARFHKSYQHLRDAGKLKHVMEDVIKIKEELDDDLERECRDEIMMYLWAELAPYVKRACRTGFDDWYKNKLEALNAAEKVESMKEFEASEPVV